MKAALINAPGATPVVEDRDLPAPAEGEVTVALEAASLALLERLGLRPARESCDG